MDYCLLLITTFFATPSMTVIASFKMNCNFAKTNIALPLIKYHSLWFNFVILLKRILPFRSGKSRLEALASFGHQQIVLLSNTVQLQLPYLISSSSPQ